MIEMIETSKGLLPAVALNITSWYVAEEDDERAIYRRDYFHAATDELVRNDLHVQLKRWPDGVNLTPGQVGG